MLSKAAPVVLSDQTGLQLSAQQHPCVAVSQWCFGLPGRSFGSWWEYFTRVILVGVLVGGR